MIASSLMTWIRANVTELATSTFVFDKTFIVSEHPLPVCVVTPMFHTTEPWVMGDASRRHNIKLQVTIYHTSDTERRFLENKIIRQPILFRNTLGSRDEALQLRLPRSHTLYLETSGT